MIRIYEPDTEGKESGSMSEKIRYTNEPLGDLEVIPDSFRVPKTSYFAPVNANVITATGATQHT